MPITVTIALPTKIRLLNRSSWISGSSARCSISTNTTMKTAERTKAPITSPLPQPSSAPWMTPYSRANRATAMVIWPGQSSDRPTGDEEFWSRRRG